MYRTATGAAPSQPTSWCSSTTASIPRPACPLSKWTARSTDHGEQVDHYTYFYDEVGEDGLVSRSVVRLDLRYFGRFELELLLQQAGLVPEVFYGSYDLAPYAAGSERLSPLRRGAADGAATVVHRCPWISGCVH